MVWCNPSREYKIRKMRTTPVTLLLITGTLLSGCNLASDAALEGVFRARRRDFEQLVAMSQIDRSLSNIPSTSAPPAESPVEPKRWKAYQSLFRDISLKEGLGRRDDYPGAIFLVEECSGTAITHDCKGYVYSESPMHPLLENLDAPPANIVFKRLDRNWYLFRDDG